MLGKVSIRSGQDFGAGVFFVVAGGAWLWVGRDYPLGTLNNMSSGFLPRVLSAILLILGVVTTARSLVVEGPAMERWAWRPLLMVVASMVAFGLLIDRAGIVVAGAALIVCGALATPDSRIVQVALTVLFLLLGSVTIFIWGLGLPIQIWPRW